MVGLLGWVLGCGCSGSGASAGTAGGDLGLRVVPVGGAEAPQYFYTDQSKAVLLLWFLTVTCS